MNKNKLIALMLMVFGINLCACSKGSSEAVTTSASPEISLTSSATIEASDTDAALTDNYYIDSEQPPKEGMVRSRITNEWIDSDINNTRPVAVMIPCSSTASYYGLSNASILYECPVEGGMTRLMGIFEDWQDIQKLGNIRSCRDYFVYWSFEWDAIYIHYGGPFYIDEVINRVDTQNINCINYPEVSFRDDAKTSTDNAFTSGELIKEAMNYYAYPLEYRTNYSDSQHYVFAPYDLPNTLEQYEGEISATKIDMSKCYPATDCYYLYDDETEQYYRYQQYPGCEETPFIDEATGNRIAFKNIIVQNTYHEVRDQKGYLAFQVHDNTRDGWFFTNGKGIHVTWRKESDYGATRYYDDYGNEIILNTGKTMVMIVKDGDLFTVDEISIGSPK